MMRLVPTLLMLALAGCAATGAIQATPSVLSEVEALKNELVMGKVASCVALLQGVSGQIQAMASGSPGLPIK